MAQEETDDLKNLSPKTREAVESLERFVFENSSREETVLKAAQLMEGLSESERKEFQRYFKVLSYLVNASLPGDSSQDKGGGPRVG